jgi:hypothetical protein
MGILDEAIREHLELKRQHGADDSELSKIEDEAFGPPARPGDLEGEPALTDAEAEAPTAYMPAPETEAPEAALPADEVPPADEAPPGPPPAEPATDAPLDEAHPAIEQEAIAAETEPPSVDQPTEHYDVEADLPAPPPPAGPPETEAEVGEEEDAFFDEQSLSDELDQALEADEPVDEPSTIARDPEPEAPLEEPPAPAPESPREDEEAEPAAGEGAYEEDEDVLEETPEFLQDTPEHDRLWFEQKPPKDFDFDG